MALVVGLVLPGTAQAVDCWDDIRSAEKTRQAVLDKVAEAEPRHRERIHGFINEAGTLLNTARRQCEEATTELERAQATAKALVAQGHLAAAQVLLKVD